MKYFIGILLFMSIAFVAGFGYSIYKLDPILKEVGGKIDKCNQDLKKTNRCKFVYENNKITIIKDNEGVITITIKPQNSYEK